jgi:hypothetical protein
MVVAAATVATVSRAGKSGAPMVVVEPRVAGSMRALPSDWIVGAPTVTVACTVPVRAGPTRAEPTVAVAATVVGVAATAVVTVGAPMLATAPTVVPVTVDPTSAPPVTVVVAATVVGVAVAEDAAQDFAVRVTGDDHDGEIRVERLELRIDLIPRNVWQLEIEKNEIELLLLGHGDGFRPGPDHQTTEPGPLEELLKECLERRIVIHDKNGRLAGFLFLPQHVTIQQAALDAPAPADLDGGQLPALDEIIDSRERNAEVFRSFLHCHEFGRNRFSHGRRSKLRKIERGRSMRMIRTTLQLWNDSE